MIKVKKGQDPYSVIGQYIRDHVSAIEDMIAVIEIDGKISNELFMVDMTVAGYFIWESDWYEGEENVVLIDFFPVSDACNPKDHWIPCSERLPEEGKDVLLTYKNNMVVGNWEDICGDVTWYANSGDGWFTATESVDNDGIPIAWMPLPKPYKEGEQDG